MKSLKSLLVAGLLALGLAESAFAANAIKYVYVVGAPAYRQDSSINLNTYATGFTGGGLTATSGPTNASSDWQGAYANQWYIPNWQSGYDLVITASYTGSTAGVESVAAYGVIPQAFLPNSTAVSGNVAVFTAGGTPAASLEGVAISENHNPDFTLSDTFQPTTPYLGTVTLNYQTDGNLQSFNFATLTGTKLAVEPYEFVASPGATAAGLTNITTSQAQLLFENGALPLSFFTGNSTDRTTLVYGLSRDPGSGSRLIVQAETGIGVTTTLTTYKPTVSGGTVNSKGHLVGGTITDTPGNIALYPAGLIPSTQVVDDNDGDTGYPQFGTADNTGLLAAITSTPPANTLFVTYLNTSDSTEATTVDATHLPNPATLLTYNGVSQALSGASNVAEGKYTFWSYQQLFPRNNIASDPAPKAPQAVVTWLTGHWVASKGIASSGVHVQRTVDGGSVLKNY